jgi:hypothetical protein
METNIDSTQGAHWQLGPSLSLADGASGFSIGEYVFARLPGVVDIEGTLVSGSGMPPTSNGSSPQHFAYIRTIIPQLDGSYELEVYPQLSFTRRGGALATYHQLKETEQANLIPLPPLSRHHPTPELFGEPLVIGGWSNTRVSWLNVNVTKFIMPWIRAVSVILFTICQKFNKLLVKEWSLPSA